MPWPIIGNTYHLPDNKPWVYFEELSKKYNTPLITYWIGRSVIEGDAIHKLLLIEEQKPYSVDQRCVDSKRTPGQTGWHLLLSPTHARFR
jgi:hypothetical protein